jgi:hypothetical protein
MQLLPPPKKPAVQVRGATHAAAPAHVHFEAAQPSPAFPQAMPQAPQFIASVATSTHPVPQHFLGAAHFTPQPPQLLSSLTVLRHVPAQ